MDEQQQPAQPGPTAELQKQSEMMGNGCLLQGVAVLLPFIGAIFGAAGVIVGLVAAVALFVKGSSLSVRWRCGACRNFVADNSVSVCPACRATFSNPDKTEYYG